ncbi:MAG: TMEM165/GDT1 family protein [Alphaproteobacteria bacterium]|nr:TMEM165/GDT1 family protein [Alphaproteobacteria bacterium]
MSSLLISTGVVALAEIGDKTQLLALVLAARFRRPWPIVLGILAATIANHAIAGAAGAFLAHLLEGPWFRWIVGVSFIAVAGWTLIPDKFSDDDAPAATSRGAFVTTLIAFFLVEIGDKTQIATIALGARFPDHVVPVVAGTTFGMLLANAPVVWAGGKLASRLPLRPIRIVAATVFAALGLAALSGIGA